MPSAKFPPRIVPAGDIAQAIDKTVAEAFPGQQIQRNRIYEIAPDRYQVHLQVSGTGRQSAREIIKVDNEHAATYQVLLPKIRAAKQAAQDMAAAAALPEAPDRASTF